MGLFGDNPFGATILDNAGAVEPCEEDCKLMPDYSGYTLAQIQRAEKRRGNTRLRVALFFAVESRLGRPIRDPAWTDYAAYEAERIAFEHTHKSPALRTFATREAFDSTVWAVKSERKPLTAILNRLRRELFPHRISAFPFRRPRKTS